MAEKTAVPQTIEKLSDTHFKLTETKEASVVLTLEGLFIMKDNVEQDLANIKNAIVLIEAENAKEV